MASGTKSIFNRFTAPFFVMLGVLAQLFLLALLAKVGHGRKAYLARQGEPNWLFNLTTL